MNRNLRLLTLATMLSGAASLMHETLWMRFLSTALGSTVQAAAAVFAAFLVGLALGARLSGGIIDRSRQVIRAYIVIEIGICVFAVGAGWLLHETRERLPAILGHSIGLSGMLRGFAITLAYVLLPTLLMGATFPAVMAAGRRLGAGDAGMVGLYGKNTIGAAAGTLLCGFYLIATFGVTSTLLIAGGLNLLAALLCAPLLSAESSRVEQVKVQAASPVPAARSERSFHQAWLYAVSLLSGAAILALEVVWTRISSFTLGNRTIAFSTLLAWVLLLLAVGAHVSGRLVARFADRIAGLLAVLLLTASVGIVLAVVLVNTWILSPEMANSLFRHSPAVVVLLRVFGMGLVMALFLVPLGCLFPTGLCCLRSIETRTGELAGRYYLWNTIGSVLGSLTTGFIAIPSLGSFASAAVVASLCSVGALVLCVPMTRTSAQRRWGWTGIGAAALSVAILPLVMPEQLHVARAGENSVLRVEDEWGVFQLSALSDGRLRVTNNRTDLVFLLGEFDTTYVQEMQAHIGSFMRPAARTALVLGSGYGITAGAFTVNPRIEHIDAVEILPAMVTAADRFQPYNRGFHRNPRVQVVVDDGRHFLARNQNRYDIISVNITDPHLPGASNLFNNDFYEVVKRHLNPDGVVIQHAFGSDKDIVLSTLKHAFHYLRAFPAYGSGYNVAVSDSPIRPERADVEQLAALPSMREALSQLGIAPPIDAWSTFSRGLPPSALRGVIRSDLISTDDRPLLEFSHRGDVLAWFFSNE
jgi:spermidine synthase